MQIDDVIKKLNSGQRPVVLYRQSTMQDIYLEVSFLEKNLVVFEFNLYGTDEGGLRMQFEFECWESASKSLLGFLSLDPQEIAEPSDEFFDRVPVDRDNFMELVRKFAAGSLALPSGWKSAELKTLLTTERPSS
jgi:hypothetical protein